LKKAAATGQLPDKTVHEELRRASECLGAALELSAGSGQIALALGHAEFRMGNLEAALAAYTRAVCLQPRLVSAYSSRAQVLQLLGRPQEALDSAKKALSLAPSDLVALKVRARIELDNSQFQDAEKTCRQILQKHPGDTQTLPMLEESLRWKEKARQAADLLFGPRAAKITSAPAIVPAPIAVRKNRPPAASRAPGTLTPAEPACAARP
jgi:tetratricopeptide (TPR) repeat protein